MPGSSIGIALCGRTGNNNTRTLTHGTPGENLTFESHGLILSFAKMAQVAIHEAKKVLRREIKKRVAAMTDEAKLKESKSIVNKVSTVKYLACQLSLEPAVGPGTI